MKNNFLVTTGLTETWEFGEKNFLLGKWCEFFETNDYDKSKFEAEFSSKLTFEKNSHHWENIKKKDDDYKYLEKKLEILLEIFSERLSAIHEVSETKEYWRIIIFPWLNEYVVTMFDRWEVVRTFFEKNKNENLYSYYLPLNDLDYLPDSHMNFIDVNQEDEWNHLIFLRILKFLKIKNLRLIEKKNSKIIDKKNKKLAFSATGRSEEKENFVSLKRKILRSIDKLLAKIAFKFNKIVFDTFYFPKMEYLKLCMKSGLIPSKYSSFFTFDIKENCSVDSEKRIVFKNSLSKLNFEDKFIKFLLLNVHKDLPKSYLENFKIIKKKILPFAKKKKIVFSMHSIFHHDNFKLYVAETKKVGSKYIFAVHGGGLPLKIEPGFNYFEQISNKIISWNNSEKKNNTFVNLSPTLPIIKFKNEKIGENCSIIFCETDKYVRKMFSGPRLDQSIDSFNEVVRFVSGLNPEIKSRIKFRSKGNFSYNSKKKFSEIFGENAISKVSFNNPMEKTLSESKLVVNTYPQTAFSETMYSNVPTILIIKKDHWQFSKTAKDVFNDLKGCQIAFEDFNAALRHINKFWKEIEIWWNSKEVQLAREKFLKNFFYVKPHWENEWSDYIKSLRKN